jgi:acyl-CoA thioesterase
MVPWSEGCASAPRPAERTELRRVDGTVDGTLARRRSRATGARSGTTRTARLAAGSEVRPVHRPDARSADGAPMSFYWVRPPEAFDTVAANQAVIAWCQPGFTIGAAMQAHPDTVRLSDSHRTVSTGVLSHTSHFHDHPTPGDWLLVVSTAAFAGNGRVFGSGSDFTSDGTLVSTFGQDAIVRRAAVPIDSRRGM